MYFIKWLCVCSLFLLLGTAGCGKKPYTYLDNEDVRVEKVSSREDGEFLVMNAVLKNKDKGAVTDTVYRVEWYDKDGVLLEQTSWRPLSIRGLAPSHVQERSTVPGAKTFNLLLSNDAS